MNFRNKKILALCLFLYGVILLLRKSFLINYSIETITGSVFLLYSIIIFYKTFNNNKREVLIFVTILFLTGIALLVKANFDVYDSRGFVFTSILFVSGSVFIVLFIENTKEKIFAVSGISLILISYLSTTLVIKQYVLNFTNKISNFSGFFWPIILIIFGISVFLNRKK